MELLWVYYQTKSSLQIEPKVRCKHHNSTINAHWVMMTKKLAFCCAWACDHWLTSEKGVHQFRYFLLLMHTPNPFVVCSCIYSLDWNELQCVHRWLVVYALELISMQMHIYMHEQTTIGFGVRISGRKYLKWCTPFSDVSQCDVPVPCSLKSHTDLVFPFPLKQKRAAAR